MAVQRRFQFMRDHDVVAIAQLGSMEACDELVRRFRGAVTLVAEQVLGSREAAQDVAQEAFLLAIRALPKLREPAKFAGWLYAITRHRAQRVRMRDRRAEPTEDSGLEFLMAACGGGQTDSPLDQILRAETHAAIRSLLEDLPPDQQVVVQLFYYEQWPAARIAEFLSLPLTTVKWRLHSGRSRLSRRLGELLEENPHGRSGSETRNTADAPSSPEDGRDGRTRRADRQLRERSSELRQAVQCHCGAP